MTDDATLPDRARSHRDRIALADGADRLRYDELYAEAAELAAGMLGERRDLAEARVAFLFPPGLDYVRTQWAIWLAGGIAVPLCTAHPPPELDYVLADAEPERIVAAPEMMERLRPLAAQRGLRLSPLGELRGGTATSPRPAVAADRRAMIVYTSGTTGGPKGVVTTHANIAAQVRSLEQAWEWSADDTILLTLPLHHVHGIVNVLCCSLSSGACCIVHPAFDAERVWESLAGDGLSLFMGVPTMYYRLVQAYRSADEATRRRWSQACRGLRLMVSGSAALPETVLEEWREITGHTLLERYGMTETGMILSNPLHGARTPGAVGRPLPEVEARLVDDDGRSVEGPGEGEVWVRGPAVFGEYWRRPEATAEAFRDGWFRTGDVGRFDGETYRLLGRSSVDIIKTGGYKVSALEIEEVLRRHPAIDDCAVVGVPDEEWGERVVVAAVGEGLDIEELREWAKASLATYKVPREVQWLSELPRNTLGKVTKPAVRDLFHG